MLKRQEVCSQNEDVPLAFYSGVGVDLKDVEPSKIARYIRWKIEILWDLLFLTFLYFNYWNHRSEEADISHFLPPLNKGNNKNGLR